MFRATLPMRWLVVVTGLALAGCGTGENQEATAPPPPIVGVVEVASRDVTPLTTFNGRVVAVDTVELRARIAGFLDTMNFTEGGEVRQGDLLFGIEKRQYQAAVLQAQGAVQRAKAALADAQLQLNRGLELVKHRNIPQSEVDSRQAKRDDAQGQLTEAQAQLEQAEINLDYTEIKAPIAGRIGAKAYSVGNYVDPSSGTLATLVSQDPIYATFPVSARELLEVRTNAEQRGQDPSKVQVKIVLPDASLYPQTGTINFVDVQVSQSTDTVTVRATFANPKRDLIDGQLVGIVVESAEPEQALLVPQAALLADQAGPYVLTVDGSGKVEQRRVKLGDPHDPDVVVAEGLKAGERVIVEGLQKVRPGQLVQLAAEPAKPAGA